MTIDHIIERPGDELGGATGANHYHVHFIGKTDTPDFPFTVFNEKVAGEIGRVMGLPCPEILVEPFNNRYYFFSHWKETSMSGMERAPKAAVAQQKILYNNIDTIHGMLIFDLFIANNDRRMENLLFRSDESISLIDQGNALLYYKRSSGNALHGSDRLEAVSKDIKKMFEDDRMHFFMHLLPKTSDLDAWFERVRSIPDYFIEKIIDECPLAGSLTKSEKESTYNFLVERKKNLRDHVDKNREFLVNMTREA